MKSNHLTVIFLFFIAPLFGQQIIDNELIIRLKDGVAPQSFQRVLLSEEDFSAHVSDFEVIGHSWNLYKMSVDAREAENLITQLQAHPMVKAVGYNFQCAHRSLTPNDSRYPDQWDMDAINAPEVWEYITGGITALGDTIVIANLEYTDYDHEDLKDNIWANHLEIPDNGIDEDSNGYKDDYYGYNVVLGGDSLDEDFINNNPHGTQTSGIMAARGNNNNGVTGVNWNVKLMVVSHTLIFSDIVKSYQYVLDMRTLYNDTNGEKGAFIVSTNASFGTGGFPDGNPILMEWCEMYNTLGEAGILSVGATTNSNEDIDFSGDMPTSCQSDYLVSVTNISEANLQRGGYSTTNVDLGAPGSDVWATEPFDGYSQIGGTSSAAPHVAGGIGLLYSAPCTKWAQLTRDDPAQAALLMKTFILDGVSSHPDLEEKTVSGGMLDLMGSFNLMQNYCGSYTGPWEILKLKTILVEVEYQTDAEGPYTVRIYDVMGRELGRTQLEPKVFDPKVFYLDVSNFATGVYFLSIENIENIISKSFAVYR
jgi:serine protease